jgi:hypothetical protein
MKTGKSLAIETVPVKPPQVIGETETAIMTMIFGRDMIQTGRMVLTGHDDVHMRELTREISEINGDGLSRALYVFSAKFLLDLCFTQLTHHYQNSR